MTDLIIRLQDWYKINCNGDWEHDNGLSLTTLDNPGWHLSINLQDTALENIEFDRQYQNANFEHDWFSIKKSDKYFEIFCGPSNLSQVLTIFFDEIIPNHSASDFLYEVYLPMTGHEPVVWTPAKGKILSENTLELVEIPPIKYSEIKLKKLDDIDFSENEMHIFAHDFRIGDVILTDIEDMFDGIKLVAKVKR